MIECAALRRKKGDREEECGGGGVGCLVFKNKEKKGGGEKWGEQTRRGGEGSGVEVRGRLAGWLAPWLACLCEERRIARLNKAHVHIII